MDTDQTPNFPPPSYEEVAVEQPTPIIVNIWRFAFVHNPSEDLSKQHLGPRFEAKKDIAALTHHTSFNEFHLACVQRAKALSAWGYEEDVVPSISVVVRITARHAREREEVVVDRGNWEAARTMLLDRERETESKMKVFVALAPHFEGRLGVGSRMWCQVLKLGRVMLRRPLF